MNKSLLSLLLSALCLSAVYAQTCLYTDGTTAGAFVDNSCSCYSGYYDSAQSFNDCTLKADSTCTFNPAPQNLQTGYIPMLDETNSNVQAGRVKLIIHSPLVTNRMNAAINFQTGSAECAYPGPMWHKEINADCVDTFIISMSLADATKCGWATASDDDNTYLRSILLVTQYDNLALRGTPIVRTTQSIIRVEIKFPKRVTVTSEINIFSSVNLLAAITLQSVDPTTKVGTLEYTTSLQYPFSITDVTGLIVPGGIVANYTIVNVDCPDTLNAPCTQLIRLTLLPDAATCKLNGDYNITTAIGCRGDQAACPLDANTNSALIASKVASEDFCQIIRFDIDLTGVLEVYQDAAHTTKKTAFLPSQTAFFLATVWSDKATIVSSSISEVKYELPSGAARSLYAAGANTALANTNQFQLTSNNATSDGFQLVISVGDTTNDLFPVNIDANAQFKFSATVEVEWQGLDTLTNGKRFAFNLAQASGLPSGTQDKKFGTSVGVTPLNNVGQTPSASEPLSNPAFSSASTVVASLASAAVALLALF